MTSSPWPTPSSISAMCSAEVPLLKPEQYCAPQYRAKSFSNCAVSGPRQKEQLSSVLAMTASRSLRSERICAGRSKYGIGSAIFFLLLKKFGTHYTSGNVLPAQFDCESAGLFPGDS